jgi:hypothetical protein
MPAEKCCRSMPRCKRCPVVLAQDRRAVAALVAPSLPPHLEGVPACLHRFEPLLRRSWEEREAASLAA